MNLIGRYFSYNYIWWNWNPQVNSQLNKKNQYGFQSKQDNFYGGQSGIVIACVCVAANH